MDHHALVSSKTHRYRKIRIIIGNKYVEASAAFHVMHRASVMIPCGCLCSFLIPRCVVIRILRKAVATG